MEIPCTGALRSQSKREQGPQEIFFSVKDVALPVGPGRMRQYHCAVECAASFRSLIRSGRVSELTDPLGQIAGYVNEQYPLRTICGALKVREIAQKKMDSLFETFDVIATAAQPVPPTRLTLNLETDLVFPILSAHWQYLRASGNVRSLAVHGKESFGRTPICGQSG